MKLSDKARRSLDRVVEKFRNNDLSAVKAVAFIDVDDLDIPLKKWSFRNRVIAHAQTGDLDCRGYRQWQQAGRQVKKGSKAAFILRPVLRKVKDDDGEDVEACAGFSSVPVYGQRDTDGEWLPEYAPASPPPLLHIAEVLGVGVDYNLSLAGMKAFGIYNTRDKTIDLATHDIETFFHELAHALHDRLGTLILMSSAKREVIADFTACVLMDMYGVDHTGNTWLYIEQFDNDPLMAVYQSLGTIEQVIELLVELDQKEVANGKALY